MLFKKKKSLTVEDQKINLSEVNGQDYVCLTDMVRGDEGSDRIKNWMRNRNTVEFLGLWETVNNQDFNSAGFDTFAQQAGLNSFTLTPKKWIDATNAKGMISKTGRGGGTYAHMDIALEFGAWISTKFKLYLNKDYQRVKEIESNAFNKEWDSNRNVSKANYQLQTDAIKNYLVSTLTELHKKMKFANEADILNITVFGRTAKQWKQENTKTHQTDGNLRESASINELIVLANAESKNAEMIRNGIDEKTRFAELEKMAAWQLKALHEMDPRKSTKRISDETYLIESKKEQ